MDDIQVTAKVLKFKRIVRVLMVLVLGVGLGFFAERMLGKPLPTAESVYDVLMAQPIPVPEGTKLLFENPGGRGGEDGTLQWATSLYLDITGLTEDKSLGISEFYKSYFSGRFPELAGSPKWRDAYFERFTSGFRKDSGGGIFIGDGVDLTWRWRCHGIGEHFFCEISTAVADFDRPVDSARDVRYSRKRVESLGQPVQGQRVMVVYLYFEGFGLSGGAEEWKHRKWPTRAKQVTTKEAPALFSGPSVDRASGRQAYYFPGP